MEVYLRQEYRKRNFESDYEQKLENILEEIEKYKTLIHNRELGVERNQSKICEYKNQISRFLQKCDMLEKQGIHINDTKKHGEGYFERVINSLEKRVKKFTEKRELHENYVSQYREWLKFLERRSDDYKYTIFELKEMAPAVKTRRIK